MPELHRFQVKEVVVMNSPVVLITGALTGIGRATALAFAREGAHVVASGRREEEGKKLVAEMRKLGAEAEFIRADVRHEEEVRKLIDKTVERFGRLDVAVNNAGTEGAPGPVTEQTAESFAATFDTNVLGTLLSMKHELRVMLPKGSGSVVNVSSAYGSVGAAGASVYVASKHAVEGLTKSAALEVAGTGVRVNVVAPGTTDTGTFGDVAHLRIEGAEMTQQCFTLFVRRLYFASCFFLIADHSFHECELLPSKGTFFLVFSFLLGSLCVLFTDF